MTRTPRVTAGIVAAACLLGSPSASAVSAIPSATTLPAAAIRVLRGSDATSVPVVRAAGRRLIRVDPALFEAAGEPLTVKVAWPFVTLARGDLSLRMALGLPGIAGPGGALAWLPDPPEAVGGTAALTPEAVAAAFLRLGVKCRWDASGDTLEVTPQQSTPAASPEPAPGPSPEEAPGVPAGMSGVSPALSRWPLHIVLDAGHGGRDCGARGETGLCEKTVTLDIVLRVAAILRAHGARITLTRDEDTFVSLPRRVRIAEHAWADLFVSIHVNASPSPRASGVETYVYGARTTSRRAADVARRENAEANYMDIILGDLAQQVHHEASIRVAGSVEKELVRRLSLTGRAHERVMEAPFYVLARSGRPAVLFEVGFISNRGEEARLRMTKYRGQLADVIASGLLGLAGRRS